MNEQFNKTIREPEKNMEYGCIEDVSATAQAFQAEKKNLLKCIQKYL